MVEHVYNNKPIYAIVLAGVLMICAGISVAYVYDPGSIKIKEEKA